MHDWSKEIIFHYAKNFYPDMNLYFGIASRNDRVNIVNLCTQYEEEQDKSKQSVLLVQVLTNNIRHIWTCVLIFGDDRRTEDKFEEQIRRINRKYCVTFQRSDCLRRSVTETGAILKAEFLEFVLITTFEQAIAHDKSFHPPVSSYYTGWAAVGASVMQSSNPTERYFKEALQMFRSHYANYPEPDNIYDADGKYNHHYDNVTAFVRDAIWADQKRLQAPEADWKNMNIPALEIENMTLLSFMAEWLNCSFLIVELLNNGEGYIIVDAKVPAKEKGLTGTDGYYFIHRVHTGYYNALRMRVATDDEEADQLAATTINEQVEKFLGFDNSDRWKSVSPREKSHHSLDVTSMTVTRLVDIEVCFL